MKHVKSTQYSSYLQCKKKHKVYLVFFEPIGTWSLRLVWLRLVWLTRLSILRSRSLSIYQVVCLEESGEQFGSACRPLPPTSWNSRLQRAFLTLRSVNKATLSAFPCSMRFHAAQEQRMPWSSGNSVRMVEMGVLNMNLWSSFERCKGQSTFTNKHIQHALQFFGNHPHADYGWNVLKHLAQFFPANFQRVDTKNHYAVQKHMVSNVLEVCWSRGSNTHQ